MAAARSSPRGSGARGGGAAPKGAKIPQVSWREPLPAPIVLVSGPEEVLAERAIAGVRDYLRAEDPALEVSDIRADDYAAGTLLGLTRSAEHTSELQSRENLVCRLLLDKKTRLGSHE